MRTYAKFSYSFLDKLVNNRNVVLVVWFGLAIYGVWQAVGVNQISNYIIFKHVYIHTLQGVNLYASYPNETTDVNLYGPVFSLLIAPFTYLPDRTGAMLWVIANALFLLIAILKLPLPEKWKNILILLSSQELMITSTSLQTNALVCGCILLGFSYIRKGKDFWALFFIMAASFIKLYGIAGLAFFFLSRKKKFFFIGAITWSFVFFFAPLIITNLNFLLQSYYDWYQGLKIKEAKNVLLDKRILYQNISVHGMIQRIFSLSLDTAFVLFPAFALFISQYLQYKYIRDIRYQLYLLCSVLIAIVIFSTGSESATYIIAIPGMCLWYLLQPKTKWLNTFFVMAFMLTSFAYSDIFTPWARSHLFRPYSLKALFPFVIWVIILIQIYTKQFLKAINPFTLMKLNKA